MKKLTCTSCGATISLSDDKEFGKCPYCGAKYKINEDININVKMDEDLKKIVNNGIESAKKGTKFIILPIIMIFVCVTVMMLIIIPKSFKQTDSNTNKTKTEFEIRTFNSKYELRNGSQPALFIKSILDDISLDNKKSEHKITLVFENEEYTNSKEITNIKTKLTKEKYEVIIDYDEEGFINKITLE